MTVTARYYVAIEERVYIAAPTSRLVGRPDMAVVDPASESAWQRIEGTLAPYRPFLVNLPTSTPDEVREWYLEVREAAGGEVVTAIELLSLTNKQRGSDGFSSYLKKRLEVLRSQTHLVELDLLRATRLCQRPATHRRAITASSCRGCGNNDAKLTFMPSTCVTTVPFPSKTRGMSQSSVCKAFCRRYTNRPATISALTTAPNPSRL